MPAGSGAFGAPTGGGGLTQAQVNALIAAGARYDGAQLSVPLLVDPDSQGFGPGVLVNEIIEFTLTGSPNGGTFQISDGSNISDPIDWNADEAAIDGVVSGNYVVTGGLDSGPGPVRIEFAGSLAGQSFTLSVDTNSLTVDGDPGGDVSFNEIQAGGVTTGDWTVDGDGTIEIGTDSGAFGLTDEAGLVERLRGGVAVTNTLIFHAGCSSTFTLVPSTVIPLTEGNLYRAWASVASAGDGNSLVFGDSEISDYETVTLPNTGMGGRALVSILFTAGNDYANAGVRLLNTTDVHIFYLAIEEIVTQTVQNGLHAVAGAHTLALTEASGLVVDARNFIGDGGTGTDGTGVDGYGLQAIGYGGDNVLKSFSGASADADVIAAFDGAGLTRVARPAIPTQTAVVDVDDFNALRTMLIAAGWITDGD